MSPRGARTKHDGMAAVGGACMASLPAALGLTAPPHMHVRTASAWATELPANTGRRTHARARGHAVAGLVTDARARARRPRPAEPA